MQIKLLCDYNIGLSHALTLCMVKVKEGEMGNVLPQQ